jgi:hypothetical protein
MLCYVSGLDIWSWPAGGKALQPPKDPTQPETQEAKRVDDTGRAMGTDGKVRHAGMVSPRHWGGPGRSGLPLMLPL